MKLAVAQKAVNLLISSPGRGKLLSLYGGEPLLNFNLIEKLIPYAQKLAKQKRKNLIVNVCTNGVLLQKTHLDFFKKYRMRLIISLVGRAAEHNKYRVSKNSTKTYQQILGKITLVFKVLDRHNVGVAFCVFPSTVGRMERNFRHIVKIGFDYINFEIIREYEQWSIKKRKAFELGFKKILDFVTKNISLGHFIFINPVSWELKWGILTQERLKQNCPFLRDLEVYPKGEMAFSPFVLNCRQKEGYLVGNLAEGQFRKNFGNCIFSKSPACFFCRHNYFRDYPPDSGADKVAKMYHFLCFEAASVIKNKARTNSVFRQYVRKVENFRCF